MRVVWTRAAPRGVWRAYDYILDFNPQAAARMAEALFGAGGLFASWCRRSRCGSLVPMRTIRASRVILGSLAHSRWAPHGEMCLRSVLWNGRRGIFQGLLHLRLEPGVVRGRAGR